MAIAVLNQVSPSWRRHFCDVGNAIRPIVSHPVQLQASLERWAFTEPELCGVEPAQLFERFGTLGDPQVRALIRVARSSDPDADAATWAVVCQFLPAIQAVARADAFTGNGTEGPRAAVNTAVAELWTHIQRINLDTNQASIFFALAARVRRSTVPMARGRRSGDRLVASLVDPADFAGERAYADDEPDRSPVPRFSGRPRMSWLDPDPTGGASAFDEAEWALSFPDLVDHLTDFLTDDMVELFGWNPRHHLFEGQRTRLHDYLRRRVSAAAEGSPTTAATIAEDIGASYQTVRDLQKEVTRALRLNADRYRSVVLASMGDADDTPPTDQVVQRQAA